MIRIGEEKIEPVRLLEKLQIDGDGAILTFSGIVRTPNLGKEVLYLDYECYLSMAERVLRSIEEETRERFLIDDVIIHHRIGRVYPREISLFCAVSSRHRKEGFDALKFIVESIKRRVPIWKKEHFEDGSRWVEGHIIEEESHA